MATVNEIEQTILRVAGHPSVGAIRDLAKKMAEEIAALDEKEVKSKRVLDERETR